MFCLYNYAASSLGTGVGSGIFQATLHAQSLAVGNNPLKVQKLQTIFFCLLEVGRFGPGQGWSRT